MRHRISLTELLLDALIVLSAIGLWFWLIQGPQVGDQRGAQGPALYSRMAQRQ
jgi:hypothetical protein